MFVLYAIALFDTKLVVQILGVVDMALHFIFTYFFARKPEKLMLY